MRPLRFIQIPLALATSLAWTAPSGAVDLTTWIPWSVSVNCTPTPGENTCSAVSTVPAGTTIVVEFDVAPLLGRLVVAGD
jgi:hypothetical protein